MLADDWTFIQPTNESYSAPRIASGALLSESGIEFEGLAAGEAGVNLTEVTVAGMPVLEIVGEAELGSINPTGDSVPLNDALKLVIGPADEKLKLDIVNVQFNPFATAPTNAQGQPLIGPFTRAGEVYLGKTFIPVKAVMKKMANHGSQAALDAAVLKADARFGALTVERSHFNAATGERVPKLKTLMKYAAPASFGMWAQQPFLAGTGCFRYVATAMHAGQKA